MSPAQPGPHEPRGPRRRRDPFVLAALGIGLFVLAAAALPEGVSPLDDPGSDRLVLPSIPTVLRFLIAGVGALMVITLILLRVTVMRGERPAKSSQKSRWRFVGLFLVALALWATFASFRQDQVTSRDGSPGGIPSPTPASDARAEDDDGPRPRYSEPFGIVVGGLVVLALGSMTVALLLLFRTEDEASGGRSIEAELIKELDAGLDDLHNIADPRSAVIACYSRMETVVHLAGVEEIASDTPFELLARILQRADVSEASARRLTELFEEAKFSIRPIDEPMRQEALSALRAVRDEIGASRDRQRAEVTT